MVIAGFAISEGLQEFITNTQKQFQIPNIFTDTILWLYFAIFASTVVWNKGYKVFCLHLNTCHFESKAKASEEAYKEFDMKILCNCDGIFALPNWGQSAGAKAEITKALALGIPVYYYMSDLPDKNQ